MIYFLCDITRCVSGNRFSPISIQSLKKGWNYRMAKQKTIAISELGLPDYYVDIFKANNIEDLHGVCAVPENTRMFKTHEFIQLKTYLSDIGDDKLKKLGPNSLKSITLAQQGELVVYTFGIAVIFGRRKSHRVGLICKSKHLSNLSELMELSVEELFTICGVKAKVIDRLNERLHELGLQDRIDINDFITEPSETAGSRPRKPKLTQEQFLKANIPGVMINLRKDAGFTLWGAGVNQINDLIEYTAEELRKMKIRDIDIAYMSAVLEGYGLSLKSDS